MRAGFGWGAVLLLSVAASAAAAQAGPGTVREQAQRFVDRQLRYDPTIAYAIGLPAPDNRRLPDRSPGALTAFDGEERADLQELLAVDAAKLNPAERATYATLREQLEADLQMRVCRTELWDVNHFNGWQSNLTQTAEAQPVGTAAERAEALERWGAVPGFVATEISNLRSGLGQGYSAPQSVVRRVIAQMDAFTSVPPEKSPFYSPAARAGDPVFQAAFGKVVAEQINPALRSYRDFLAKEYLPKARTGVAVIDLPHGAECYEAFLRQNTTLKRSAAEVYALGEKTVAANTEEVKQLGQRLYGKGDVPAIVAAMHAAPEDHFRSPEELLSFSRAALERDKAITAKQLIDRMPKQEMVIEPLKEFEEAAGVSSQVQPSSDPKIPAKYRIRLTEWKTETQGEAEIVVAHESWPGHHLQMAVAAELLPDAPLAKLINNAAYAEGWARYAEWMAEGAGMYTSPDAAITRRLWPARGDGGGSGSPRNALDPGGGCCLHRGGRAEYAGLG